ncbi:3-dehydroquinate synthase [Algoriphagus sp. CAU 1675]|uniref:3-dehydroquinate synthase n=1 Tax=Algoriphagus sp. CAU 1675 TaxID=3032597 RepID=UPI0023D9B4AC|nr:3-dehydroquinate synthase [Algoriphagus sp. CAU 1675]MDF2158406.1 3-dehydroquinate synthase [Algoriphagus sp. CAU 1675]
MNPILFSKSIAQDLGQVLKEYSYSRIFVLTDENTKLHCLPKISHSIPADSVHFTIPAGEIHKNLDTCTQIWSKMTAAQLDRKALLINLGGGVLGDMGGFCASIYKRGIRFVNIPTTLLSQVDASVGGKLGVDFQGLKNHLGVFNEPETVLIAPEFLETLPLQELRSGFAEIMKHGLIRDKSYFENLDLKNWENSNWTELIRHSVEIKKSVVLEDPKESGLRKILNFGHTVGHAFETYYLDSPKHLLHGEAIAAGMICEAWLSSKKLSLPETELKQIEQAFLSVFGKIQIENREIEAILDFCLQDKKNEGSTLMFSLLNSIGDCTYNIPVTREEIRESIAYYQSLS